MPCNALINMSGEMGSINHFGLREMFRKMEAVIFRFSCQDNNIVNHQSCAKMEREENKCG